MLFSEAAVGKKLVLRFDRPDRQCARGQRLQQIAWNERPSGQYVSAAGQNRFRNDRSQSIRQPVLPGCAMVHRACINPRP